MCAEARGRSGVGKPRGLKMSVPGPREGLVRPDPGPGPAGGRVTLGSAHAPRDLESRSTT
eukprot:scaffold89634_cov29-Phaeocystis_antarctica.AAC.2